MDFCWLYTMRSGGYSPQKLTQDTFAFTHAPPLEEKQLKFPHKTVQVCVETYLKNHPGQDVWQWGVSLCCGTLSELDIFTERNTKSKAQKSRQNKKRQDRTGPRFKRELLLLSLFTISFTIFYFSLSICVGWITHWVVVCWWHGVVLDRWFNITTVEL